MPVLEIRLLGQPEIRVNGTPVRGLPAKLEALVYYLAISPRSVSRSTLAGLLWGERTEQDARMNLRAALQKVPPALAPHIVVTRDWLALDRNGEPDVDVQRFDQTLGALSAAPEGRARRLERLAEIAALFRGEFLAGFAPGHAPEFEAWCATERSRLHQGAVRLHGEILKLRRETGRDEDVAEDARRILQLSPGHDAALCELMAALARAGQRNAALEEFERHRRIWRDELDLEPSEEAVRLAERIVAGETDTDGARAPGSQAAQLIGREHELALLSSLLSSPETRIVSITGLGGMGKTRLAQAVMAGLKARFGDGTAFFSVAAMRSGKALAPAMVAAFGLQMQGRAAPMQYVLDYLREKDMLLVFDGFESVLGTEAVDLLVAIAQAAPAVRCLVTSRESLGMAEEAAVAVEGLAYPREDDEDWRASPAIRLFVERAARGYVQFDAERERTGIVRICERVAGVPLAIELAASMARTLPCVEIARAIERDLGTLARDDAGFSPRHRSLVGVLTCAFAQLAPELQARLACLAAFRGPFGADAADQVAGCSLRQLSALVEKSWLRRDPRAGYSMHDLVRQFAAGRQGPLRIDARGLDRRHAEWFLGLIAARCTSLQSGEQSAALDEIQAVLADVQEACEWGAAHAQDAGLERSLEGLYRYFENRGDYLSAAGAFGALVPRLEKRRAGKRLALASASCSLGWAQAQLAQLDACVPALERAVALARKAGGPRILAEAQRGLALALVLGGKPGAVSALLEESLAHAREAGDVHNEVATLILMGVAVSYLGTGRGQHDYYERAIELARRIDYPRALMVAYFNLGDAHLSAGRLDESEACFREARKHAIRAGNRRHQVMGLANLAAIALEKGNPDESRRLADEAYAIARSLGDRRAYSFLSQAYAELEAAAGRPAGALEWADRMIAVADEIAWGWSAAFGVTLRAEALTRLGEREAARSAILDLHARVGSADFGVHHGNVALEAARWILGFEPDGRLADVAGRGVRALGGPMVLDAWVTKRAQQVAMEAGLAPGPAFAGEARELMQALVEGMRA